MTIKPSDIDVKWKKVEDKHGKRYDMMVQHLPTGLVESGEGYKLDILRDRLVKALEPRVDEFNRTFVTITPLVAGNIPSYNMPVSPPPVNKTTPPVWKKHDGGPCPIVYSGNPPMVLYKIAGFPSRAYGPDAADGLRWEWTNTMSNQVRIFKASNGPIHRLVGG